MKLKAFLTAGISFITAALLAAVIFVFSEIYPGSARTLLIFDMQEQFASFYSSLKGLLSGEVTFSYTFQGSLGTPYTGTYAYYLASPLSFITLFFDTRHLPDAIWLMDIIKAGLIGASFSAFAYFRGLRKMIPNVALSMCYALSTAAVTFFLLPMYLDTMYMLPVICIFLEKLIRLDAQHEHEYEIKAESVVKAGIIYALALGAGIVIHYYSMYMVCIFLALYAVFLITELPVPLKVSVVKENDPGLEFKNDHSVVKDFFRRYSRFIIWSLAGAACALPMLIPVMREIVKGKAGDRGVYSTGSFIVTRLSDLLKQFTCGHFGYLYSEGAPYIYCTVLVLILALFGVFFTKARLSNRICSLFIILFIICSFIFRPLYRMWHFFRDPVAYPHRFSFIFVFFVMVLAVRAVKDITEKIDFLIINRSLKKDISGDRDIAIKPGRSEDADKSVKADMFGDNDKSVDADTSWDKDKSVIADTSEDDDKYGKADISGEDNNPGISNARRVKCVTCAAYIATGILMTALIAVNGIRITSAAFDTHTMPYIQRWDYDNFIALNEGLVRYAQEECATGANGVSLCRINKDYEVTSNDPMLLGYNGMDFFSSSYDSDMLEFYKNLGILQYHYKVCDQGTTIVTDMLLGVDYQIRYGNPEYGYEWVTSNSMRSLYRNPYSLGIGYLAGGDNCEFGKDSFANQNMLLGSVLGEECSVFEEVEYTERLFEFPGVSRSGLDGTGAYYGSPMKVRKLYFPPINGQNLYINYELVREYELDYDSKANSVTMNIAMNDRIYGSFTGYQRASNTYLGRDYRDEDYVVELIGDQEERPCHIYVLDMDMLEEAYRTLNSGRFIASEIEPGHIEGKVNVTDDIRNELVFTISFDERYMAYVDGVRTETYAYAGGLLAIPDLTPGEHFIELKYR